MILTQFLTETKKSKKKLSEPFLDEVMVYQSSYEPLFWRKKTGGVRSLESRKPKTLMIRSNK